MVSYNPSKINRNVLDSSVFTKSKRIHLTTLHFNPFLFNFFIYFVYTFNCKTSNSLYLKPLTSQQPSFHLTNYRETSLFLNISRMLHKIYFSPALRRQQVSDIFPPYGCSTPPSPAVFQQLAQSGAGGIIQKGERRSAGLTFRQNVI